MLAVCVKHTAITRRLRYVIHVSFLRQTAIYQFVYTDHASYYTVHVDRYATLMWGNTAKVYVQWLSADSRREVGSLQSDGNGHTKFVAHTSSGE